MLLSIVIPVYNASKTIVRCLDSIWSQKLPEDGYEVICVDDCSADSSVEILQAIQRQHSNLIVLSNPENLHAGGARNNGVRSAHGEYILFIDSDDYFHPGSLLKAFEYLKSNSDLDILTCNFARELPNSPNNKMVHAYASSEKISIGQYITLNHIPCGPCQWFFRRKLMTENHIYFREHTICEDVDWTHRLVLFVVKIQYQPILLCHYVIDAGTQTALSYAKPEHVYAYMEAGNVLYHLKQQYAELGHADYIESMARGYIQQGLKYYLAMYDKASVKKTSMQEFIPEELSLSGCWAYFRRLPGIYAMVSNLLFPITCVVLKLKAKYSFRGIRK